MFLQGKRPQQAPGLGASPFIALAKEVFAVGGGPESATVPTAEGGIDLCRQETSGATNGATAPAAPPSDIICAQDPGTTDACWVWRCGGNILCKRKVAVTPTPCWHRPLRLGPRLLLTEKAVVVVVVASTWGLGH